MKMETKDYFEITGIIYFIVKIIQTINFYDIFYRINPFRLKRNLDSSIKENDNLYEDLDKIKKENDKLKKQLKQKK